MKALQIRFVIRLLHPSNTHPPSLPPSLSPSLPFLGHLPLFRQNPFFPLPFLFPSGGRREGGREGGRGEG